MTIYELAWSFYLYAFLGWAAEAVYAAIKEKRFLNRGFLNGPFCPVYGLGAVIMQALYSGEDSIIFLFISCCVSGALLEFFTGLILEKLFHRRWWSYSRYRFQLNGYVSLRFTILWGVGGVVALRLLNPVVFLVLADIPRFAGKVILLIITAALLLDMLTVTGVIVSQKKKKSAVTELTETMQKLTTRMGKWIAHRTLRRMEGAFPGMEEKEQQQKSQVFAYGCCFYKLVWLFAIGAFLGDLTETVFCRITMGVWMSRSSVVWGPFSVVWGIGIVVLTIMLHPYRDKDDRYIFLFGTIVGGVYEYGCSVFTELVFGTVFWDYSGIPFNLAGRINLLYCFFWGVAAVTWIKILYPPLSRLIEKIHKPTGKVLTWMFLVFFLINALMSSLALIRYSQRANNLAPRNAVESWVDTAFPDERMEKIYPKAIVQK